MNLRHSNLGEDRAAISSRGREGRAGDLGLQSRAASLLEGWASSSSLLVEGRASGLLEHRAA